MLLETCKASLTRTLPASSALDRMRTNQKDIRQLPLFICMTRRRDASRALGMPGLQQGRRGRRPNGRVRGQVLPKAFMVRGEIS
jgi:hypothetical protein